MKVLCVHAHYDDFEFVASGIFQLWRQRLGSQFQGRLIICTDGSAGHHFRTRQETARLRLEEQRASASIGQYEFELLRLPNGRIPREACLQVTPDLLAALWKTIRDFQPDYLLCPPLACDPLVGIHNDHQTVAEAVRRVAYMINVPHAFTAEYPADETQSRPCPVPVILNVYDSYMSATNAFDLAVDVQEVFPAICRMSWCHQTQIKEWLPWVGCHGVQTPADEKEWAALLGLRFIKKNQALGIRSKRPMEVFAVTAWGAVPAYKQLLKDFPKLVPVASHLTALRDRLKRWAQDYAF